MLFADGPHVFLARTLNISEDGLLVDELPGFPEADEVPLMISVPVFPLFKNLSLLQVQNFTGGMVERRIIRAKARIVRKHELSQNLDNIFKAKFGLQFAKVRDEEREAIAHYVSTFSSNLIHLQTLIDSFNADETARERTRALKGALGYREERIAQLRVEVSHDYQSLQWL